MPESPNNQDLYFYMDLALKQAQQSEEDVPVGAVIVQDGSIIAVGVNERERTLDPTGHAEIVALRKAAQNLNNWRLTGCQIYVTLEPCAMCAEALIQARVSTIVFGAYDPRSGACGSLFNLFVEGRPYPMPEIIGGIMEANCKKLLTEFFRNRPDGP
jgi:tRNA(adenine34) deaminase